MQKDLQHQLNQQKKQQLNRNTILKSSFEQKGSNGLFFREKHAYHVALFAKQFENFELSEMPKNSKIGANVVLTKDGKKNKMINGVVTKENRMGEWL